MITAFVGSGGKTGTILALAQRLAAQGRRVLMTTTTHIERMDGAVVGDDVSAIAEALCAQGAALAGQAAGEKLGALNRQTYESACALADDVLVEADGSRALPLKCPAAHEPAIPENAQEIVVCVGLSALGRPLGEVCHRAERAAALLGVGPEARVTAALIQRLVTLAYVRPLRERYPEKRVRVLARQCDGLHKRAVGAMLEAEADVTRLDPAWFAPQPHLLVCGAGHVGRALAAMAALLDWQVTVYDDRPDFADPARFPSGVRAVCDAFDRLPRAFSPGMLCVVATRGHAQDEHCVRMALGGDFAYLGMMGSRRKVAQVRERLLACGIPQAQIDRIHMPIGLPIGAQTPAEIAVSILAQIIGEMGARATAGPEFMDCERAGVLCVITRKAGSTPRGVGSMMLVTDAGIVGSIGGGRIEYMAARDAREARGVLEREYALDASADMACGGRNRVLMVPLGESLPYTKERKMPRIV